MGLALLSGCQSSEQVNGSSGSPTSATNEGAVPSPTPAAKLIAEWNFSDVTATGATAADSSGSALNLTVNRTYHGVGVSTSTPTGSGQALTFNNNASGEVDDLCVEGAENTALQLTTSGTLTAWINASASQLATYWSSAVIATKGSLGESTPDYGLFLYNPGSGEMQLAVKVGLQADFAYSPIGPVLNDGKWHHVAFTFQSGVTNGSYLYVDGVRTYVFTYTIPLSSYNTEFCIGASDDAGYYGFQGSIFDVRVYNTALDPSAVQALAIP
jgi:hypothetical protein